MRIAIVLAGALALAGCGLHPEALVPKVMTQKVEVPVMVPCWVKVNEPDYVDSDQALRDAPTDAAWVQLLKAGRIQRVTAIGMYKAAEAVCSATPAPPVATK